MEKARSTTRVLSNSWTDLVVWLRMWVYMRHLEKTKSRGNLLARPRPATGYPCYICICNFPTSKPSSWSDREQDEVTSAICIYVCLPALIYVVGQICLFTHMYCTQIYLCTWLLEMHSSLITGQSWAPEVVSLWEPQSWQPLWTSTGISTCVLQILKTSGLILI